MNTTQGTIYMIEETRKVSERFRVREFVVEIADNSKYPQLVKFQVTNDLCGLLDNCQAGDIVALEFNLRGREWTSPKDGKVKYFNSLDVRALDVIASGPNAAAPATSDPLEDIPF